MMSAGKFLCFMSDMGSFAIICTLLLLTFIHFVH